MRDIQIVVDGILVTVKLLSQHLVVGRLLGKVLNEVWYLDVMFVLPGIGVAPMGVEITLNLTHLLDGGLLSIFLHTGVYGRIDFQTVAIEVVLVFLTPFIEIVLDSFPEILCLAIVVVLNAVVQMDWDLFQHVKLLLSKMMMLQHVAQHHVTTSQRILRVDTGIIIGGSLQQSDKNG